MNNNLEHSKWSYKYYIVFEAKYRRQINYVKIKVNIGVILRKLWDQNEIEIIEVNS